MNNEECKEHYKYMIKKAIDSIDSLDLLVYLHRLILNIIKAGR